MTTSRESNYKPLAWSKNGKRTKKEQIGNEEKDGEKDRTEERI